MTRHEQYIATQTRPVVDSARASEYKPQVILKHGGHHTNHLSVSVRQLEQIVLILSQED
jgi:hypothetical protein